VPDRPLLRRRTAVLGLAATVLATGCDHGDDIGTSSPSKTPSTPAPSTSAPAQTPDEVLVDTTIDQLTTAYGVVVTARRFKSLRQPLAPLVKAHRRHVEVLEGELEGWTAPELADPDTALQAVRRSEKKLHAALVEAAGKAESGALAKLLASMSASVTQFLVALPPEVTS